MNWTESKIARIMAVDHYRGRHLAIVPNCNWTGYEADLLVVTKKLRLIDIEIKISRADLKADAKKSKWFDSVNTGEYEDVLCSKTGRVRGKQIIFKDLPRLHPSMVWRHYFAMPAAIWDDSLYECLPSEACGVYLLHRYEDSPGRVVVEERRRAKENRKAPKISPESAIDIARLASLRMWNALEKLEAA